MRSDFDELKRFAIADILSVSGRQKTTETVDMHINTIIDIAFLKGQQESQSKVDALTLQVAEMKSRLNDAYTDGQSAMYTARQSKIDELTKQRDSFIKAYEIEMDESVELQKRVDAVKVLAQTLWEKSEEKHQQGKVWESKTLGECADEILDVLEQALKGGFDHE